MRAYEETIRRTATPWAPWHVIPADRKWFTRLAVAAAIIDAIESVNPTFPAVSPKLKEEFKIAKASLESEGQPKK